MKLFPQVTMAVALMLAAPILAEPTAKPANDNVASVIALKFNAYDGDLGAPKTLSFSIRVLGLQQPSNFLKIGQTIPNTTY